ncbi:hypothetical protein ACMD2_24050 [Ananas comosus]|uniref:Uncharacterized protein n=1 Tax=Ananas comosus TaxID=4615 RepID=A0A199V4Z5_ANACO|nr:hypothetical protein ACMD2_24050 [Ananas comosus]
MRMGGHHHERPNLRPHLLLLHHPLSCLLSAALSSSPAVPRLSALRELYPRLFSHPPLTFARLSLQVSVADVSLTPHHTVVDDSKQVETSADQMVDRSESDQLVDALDFGELCNDFECISSPAVESTARQIVRDILELREDNRALGCFSTSVKYKDPLRTFTGREKYKRPLWVTNALENPTVTVQEMGMLSTSELIIKWTLRGKPKNPHWRRLDTSGGLQIHLEPDKNQISGQVVEHVESWDLSASSIIVQAYFWFSRRLFSTIEAGKDTIDAVKSTATNFSTRKENLDIYPDPSGDPTKFFQRDDGLQRDAYQIALFLAVIYFVVQFLRATL